MRSKLLFALAILGIVTGLVAAYMLNLQKKPQPPAFVPASNPFEKGVYANGIIETAQNSGENINIYPEVPGTVTSIPVQEGQQVQAGMTLFTLEDSIQRSAVEQQKAQGDLARAQIVVAEANLKTVQDEFDKQNAAAAIDPRLVSKDVLDTARNAVLVARANVEAAHKQAQVAEKSYQMAVALLNKYTLKAQSDSTVLSINTAVGSYISSQGVYDTYTDEFKPVLVMGNLQNDLAVRCYIDEILIQRLPNLQQMQARMFIHGTDVSIPLHFVRIQPNVSPKIELSDQRTERVDVRVLPVIFSIEKQKGMSIYPGQLVDVYIGEQLPLPEKP